MNLVESGSKQAFTLAEMIMCFLIISIVAAVELIVANPYQKVNQRLYSKAYDILETAFYNVYADESDSYGTDVKTVQDQLTTLKKKEDSEEYEDRGYASNYDHFSYDESAIGHVVHGKPRRVDAVRKYCGDDFEKYFKTISDHIPIVMELKIN